MILAVIPSRMGSARMPRKNLCEIEPGLTLVQQAIDCARHSGLVDAIAISSDEVLPCRGDVFHVKRPPALCGPTSDICDAVHHATAHMEAEHGMAFDYVVTLQPAVVARSPLIVRRLLEAVTTQRLSGGLTMATTHRWVWQVADRHASNDWYGHPYPRSQDGGQRLVEINAAQVASREVVGRRERWGAPLAILELPAWCASLDIDTPADLEEARALWPWARTRLETWAGPIRTIAEVTACA